MAIRAFDVCVNEPWAIIPDHLQMILEITQTHANGEQVDIEAVAAKLGRPLENTRSVEMRGGVAVIPITGPIVRFADWFTEVSGLTSIETLALDLNKAIDDPKVKAILFDVESPGGSVSGINDFAQMIYKARSSKPVYAFAGDLMASAAYWIGSAAEKTFASRAARIGSIGVVTAIEDYSEAREKRGVKEYKFVSSQSPKKQPDPSTDEGASDIQTMIDDLAGVFVSDVAKYRGVTDDHVLENFGQGGVMVAEKALAAGMIDGIKTFEETIELLNERTEKKPGARNAANAEPVPPKLETKNMPNEDTKPQAEAPAITREYLNANHAELIAGIKAEGTEEGKTAERERVQALEQAVIPGHEDLLAEAKKDGSDVATLQARMCEAEKKVRTSAVASIAADAPAPPKIETDATPAPKPEANADDDEKTPEEQWEAMSAKDQLAFAGGKGAFIAGAKAMANGRVKVLKK